MHVAAKSVQRLVLSTAPSRAFSTTPRAPWLLRKNSIASPILRAAPTSSLVPTPTMAPKKDNSTSASQQNGNGGGGSGKVEPPKTGWTGPVPSKEGGAGEVEYMFKPPYFWHSDEFEVKWTSSCWCGKVKFEYAGDPIDAKHCHCTQCQRLHGAPFQYAALFHKTSVRMHKGCDPTFVDFFSTHRKHSEHDVPCKVSCRNCRSSLMDEGRNMIMAYPSSFNFPDGHVPSAFAPSCHIFYKEAIIEIDDGVPKWSGHKDLSELLPHAAGEHGKLGKGRSGQEKRGEVQSRNAENAGDQESGQAKGEGDEQGVTEKEEYEHDDDYFYSSQPKQAERRNQKNPESAGGHHKKRKFPDEGDA